MHVGSRGAAVAVLAAVVAVLDAPWSSMGPGGGVEARPLPSELVQPLSLVPVGGRDPPWLGF